MKLVRPEARKIATVSILIVMLLFGIADLLNIPTNLILLKTGTVISFVGLFWYFYDQYGWKIRFLTFGGWLSNMPNLNGRYEGVINRRGENNPHDFVLEIKQTYRNISINSYSKNSTGYSITASIVKGNGEKYYLYYIWYCRTTNMTNPNEKDDFFGTSITEISQTKDGTIHLKDDYFTRRNPPTKGETNLKLVSKELIHRFH